MTRGAETPEDLKLKFRAEYLITGNAAESARRVGIPESTGRDIAKELNSSQDFAEDRRILRASFLDELVNMRMKMARKAFSRFDDDTPPEPGDIDKRPDYGRLITDAEKNAHALAKIEAGNEPGANTSGTALVIKLAKE